MKPPFPIVYENSPIFNKFENPQSQDISIEFGIKNSQEGYLNIDGENISNQQLTDSWGESCNGWNDQTEECIRGYEHQKLYDTLEKHKSMKCEKDNLNLFLGVENMGRYEGAGQHISLYGVNFEISEIEGMGF